MVSVIEQDLPGLDVDPYKILLHAGDLKIGDELKVRVNLPSEGRKIKRMLQREYPHSSFDVTLNLKSVDKTYVKIKVISYGKT